MINQTSIDAHHSNDYGDKIQVILQTLRSVGPLNRRSIAKLTGYELGTVAGRVNELVAKGKAESCGLVKDPMTGKTTELIRAIDA